MSDREHSMRGKADGGFMFATVLILLAPLAVLIGAFTTSMSARTKRLVAEMASERAMLAAEAGLDDALYRAETGALSDDLTFDHAMPSGTTYDVVVEHLGSDGMDDDGDGTPDDADEDVFRVISTGHAGAGVRRIAAYLRVDRPDSAIDAAVSVHNRDVDIRLSGNAAITGHNHDLDGRRGEVSDDIPGLGIAPPGTLGDLTGELSSGERSKVTGKGGTPSLTVGRARDFAAIEAAMRNGATRVIPAGRSPGSNTTPEVLFCEGDVTITGNTLVRGILFVRGDLRMSGTAEFHGVIYVLGSFEMAGNARIHGAVVQGPAGREVRLHGTPDVRYSREGVELAGSIAPPTGYGLTGWQEIARD